MAEDYSVAPMVLIDSAGRWTDQSSRLATARTRLLEAPSAGFSDLVAARAVTWASTWGTVVGDLADRSDLIAEELDSAFTAYTSTDMVAQERFQTWLGGTP